MVSPLHVPIKGNKEEGRECQPRYSVEGPDGTLNYKTKYPMGSVRGEWLVSPPPSTKSNDTSAGISEITLGHLGPPALP